MSNIKLERPQEAIVDRSSVRQFQKVIENLCDLALSARSPAGKIKILQNSSGGHLVLTSSCRRLLQSLSISKPVIQLLVSATQGHLDQYSDGGLFVLGFACDLVLKALESSINSKLLAEIFETFLSIIQEFMTSDTCALKFNALVSDVHFMKCFVEGIIQPKLFCGLDGQETSFISKLLLEVFLQCVPENDCTSVCDNVFLMSKDTGNVTDSVYYPGIILEAPELSKFRQVTMTPVTFQNNSNTCIKVALVTASLSGDLSELDNVKYEVMEGVGVDDAGLTEITSFTGQLIHAGVGLLLCQRVIHPAVKLQLRDARVIVVDRMGLNAAKYITKLTGARPIQCLDSIITEHQYGSIDHVQHVIIKQKSYLHLTRANNSVNTLVLYHQQDKQLQELKCVSEACLHSLEKLLCQPQVLPGGGCWQVILAQYLQQKVTADVGLLCEELECPERYIMQACGIFLHALVSSGLPKTGTFARNACTGHVHACSSLTDGPEEEVNRACQCGIFISQADDEFDHVMLPGQLNTPSFPGQPSFTYKSSTEHVDFSDPDAVEKECILKEALLSRPVVMDASGMCTSALQTAVLTASSILKIEQIMENL